MSADAVVHLVDDDEEVRQSLAFLLMTTGLAVRTHESAAAFLDAIDSLQPGCVVSDVRMPGIDGLELLRRLQGMDTRLPVIIITGHADVPLAVQAMKAGAIDFIEKPFDDEVLLAAIRKALDQYRSADRRDTSVAQSQAKLQALSVRERQVLTGLLAGKSNKAIAFDLKLSPRTVEVHRANIMTKMEVSSLSALVRMAMAAGLMTGAD
jgi:two-component system, LuxR family, response regulator FixJ